jgi:hypothetical protein
MCTHESDLEWLTGRYCADQDTMATPDITATAMADSTIGIAEDEQKIEKM